jgi:hypothetical protein
MDGAMRAVRGCVRRRAFLAGLGGGVASWLLAQRGSVAAEAPPSAAGTAKPRIRVVFSHHRVDAAGKQREPGWPYLG